MGPRDADVFDGQAEPAAAAGRRIDLQVDVDVDQLVVDRVEGHDGQVGESFPQGTQGGGQFGTVDADVERAVGPYGLS